MANVTKNNITRHIFGGTPYGNVTAHRYTLDTDATGVLVDSSQATAIAAGDVVRLGILPAGTELHDSLTVISVVLAGATAIGFEYIDGVDDAVVPQDDDYFNAAADISAQGRVVADNVAVAPVVLPKDAYLILTVAAAQTAAGVVDVIVNGIWTGLPSVNPV